MTPATSGRSSPPPAPRLGPPAPASRRSTSSSSASTPDVVSARGTRSWYVRSQNCCVVFSLAQAGDALVPGDQPDEYVLLFPSADASAVVTAGDHRGRGGRRSRWRSCRRARARSPSRPAVRSYGCSRTRRRIWPAPLPQRRGVRRRRPERRPVRRRGPTRPAGRRIRVYPLADIPEDPGRFGRLLRCSTIMVNYFYPDDRPRDPKAAVAPPPRRLRADLAAARR